MEIPKTVKENKDNDLLLRKNLSKLQQPIPNGYTGQVYNNLEEASKSIKPEDIEYFTD